jgi:hypothetical protein
MNATLTFTSSVHFKRAKKGMLRLVAGPASEPAAAPSGRVPKLARLMALAIRLDNLLRAGDVTDYAELARIGHVSRARVSQIMNLLMLAPDIQEAILFLPPVVQGRDPLKEWQVRPIAAEMNWNKQRRMWRKLSGE